LERLIRILGRLRRESPATYIVAALVVFTLAACNPAASGFRTQSTRVPATAAGAPAPLPDTSATAVIRPEEGGIVALRDGAEASVPPDALTGTAVASLRVAPRTPAAPIPRNVIGRAYEFSLEGGELSGVTKLTLPLPADVAPDQYDLAAYRWDGRMWERVSSRAVDRVLQVGVSTPGIFSIQGQWRLADATVGLALPAVEPGRPTVQMTAAGQYHYAALPTLQHDYVQARLTLKRDTSGGSGQVTGDPTKDETVAEAILAFKPDPAQAQGIIEFTQAFEVSPGQLDMVPGTTSNFYTVLTVDDSASPTRRVSPGIQYSQVLPIQAVGTDVVRPALVDEQKFDLRWHVRLNGKTMVQPPADSLKLALPDLLAQGGIGEYHITLEALSEGSYVPVSNEVIVQLNLPATPTPTPSQTPVPSPSATAIPGQEGGLATPDASMPPTPTRRSPPGARTAEPTAGATPTYTATPAAATPSPTRPDWASVFWADRYVLAPGECTNLHWEVQDVTAVYLDGNPTTGAETRQVCPGATTVYTLRVAKGNTTQDRRVTITVQEAGQVALEFTADDYEVPRGSCTTLHWRVTDVSAVYLDDVGVAGESSRQVCPSETTTYEIRAEGGSSKTTTKETTISVVEPNQIVIDFWAEQYTLQPGKCTTLHWSVHDVQEVFLLTTGPEEGVAGVGTREICPTGRQFYTLRANASDNRSATKQITLDGYEPSLGINEVVAQGIVNSVARVSELAPNQPGRRLVIDGINPLFVGSGGFLSSVASLEMFDTQISRAPGSPVDWPINPGQLVEFRAVCTNNICKLQHDPNYYLHLRSD